MTFQNTQPDKIDDERWESALERRRVIERWLEIANPTKELAADFAAKLNCSVPTFYRWVQNFRKDHQTSSLVVGLNRGNKTKQRLHPDVEKIISDVIKNLYLTKERPIRARVVEEVELRCFKAKLSPPSKPTIYRRIADVPAFIATEHRYSKRKRNSFLSHTRVLQPRQLVLLNKSKSTTPRPILLLLILKNAKQLIEPGSRRQSTHTAALVWASIFRSGAKFTIYRPLLDTSCPSERATAA